ncbi:hypothetical protein [Candidatus Methylobacter favarea]|uniref:hypothetical protein n=1 Tax=Candidatus Methylobacter favarea TaxID=2707345 RepID=UPI00157D1D74|nr:hypothetical protein [Candidatus Methylobacter favarea]
MPKNIIPKPSALRRRRLNFRRKGAANFANLLIFARAPDSFLGHTVLFGQGLGGFWLVVILTTSHCVLIAIIPALRLLQFVILLAPVHAELFGRPVAPLQIGIENTDFKPVYLSISMSYAWLADLKSEQGSGAGISLASG